MSRTKGLASISSLLVGGFLYFRYAALLSDNLWGLRWYEAALLLAGLGLAGLFPAAWFRAALSTAMAAFLGAGVQTYLDISRDPKCCNLWPIGLAMWFFLGFPAPLIGGVIGHRLCRTRAPRLLYLLPLAGGLVMGASLPLIRQAEYRRLETEEIPALLRQIYAAEISYRASRADRTFTCDGRQLQDVRKLVWTPDRRKASFTVVEQYTIRLTCPDDASRFQITAFSRSRKQTGPTFSIDETGKLVVSRESAGQPR